MAEWSIAVHGGSGSMTPGAVDEPEYKASLRRARDAGQRVLRGEDNDYPIDGLSPALQACMRAVEAMEDDPLFNAGRGAVLNESGEFELEASVMEGSTLQSGAVCGLSSVKQPVRLAALVLLKTRHQLLGFSGAERFADDFPALIERTDDPAYFWTERRAGQWRRAQQRNTVVLDHSLGGFKTAAESPSGGNATRGTVGAVAKDRHGNVACATSTGGVTNKMVGRIGDTPMVGAGFYASSRSCALSGTGFGDEFIRHNAAGFIAAAMEVGKLSLREAVAEMVERRFSAGTGGFIAVDREGSIDMQFNATGMFRAAADSNGRDDIGIWQPAAPQEQ